MGREWRSRFCTGLAAQDGTRNGSVTPQFDRGLGGDAHDSPEYGQQAVDLDKLDLALGILGLHQPFQQCGCCRVVHDVKLAAVDDAIGRLAFCGDCIQQGLQIACQGALPLQWVLERGLQIFGLRSSSG